MVFWIEESSQNHCAYCAKDFGHQANLDEHNKRNHEHCGMCNTWLNKASDMKKHNQSIHHLCVECDRYFSSVNELKNHLNSSTHRPKTVVCPGRRCERTFIHIAALILHLESGVCVSGVTRSTVDRFVAERDLDHFIINPRRMITGPAQIWAARNARKGQILECHFCNREFQSLRSLKQHFASPAHKQPAYWCPPQLSNGCGTQFRSLSALCQHIESGSCNITKVEAVSNYIRGLVQVMNRPGCH
ncbi:hypothetical protein BDV93DRAFT_519614 [Ceratobasidium sp. AG-I]|nr:hypothetical protein BDV93DRAFT_519614 [Ceratobasidium sp. AG-I]